MPDHRIRLRGAWELSDGWGGGDATRRLSLPTDRRGDLAGPVRLSRRLGTPPIDPSIEAISLELLGVPGLVRIEWNGLELPLPPAGSLDWVVPLAGPWLGRNTLTLDVDLDPSDRPEAAGGWGTIALVISPRVDPG